MLTNAWPDEGDGQRGSPDAATLRWAASGPAAAAGTPSVQAGGCAAVVKMMRPWSAHSRVVIHDAASQIADLALMARTG